MFSGETCAGTEMVTKAWPHFDHPRLVAVRVFLSPASEHGSKTLNQVVASSNHGDGGLKG